MPCAVEWGAPRQTRIVRSSPPLMSPPPADAGIGESEYTNESCPLSTWTESPVSRDQSRIVLRSSRQLEATLGEAPCDAPVVACARKEGAISDARVELGQCPNSLCVALERLLGFRPAPELDEVVGSAWRLADGSAPRY